jgi:hypothetical protein
MEITTKDIRKLTKHVLAYKVLAVELRKIFKVNPIDQDAFQAVADKLEKQRKQIDLLIQDNFFFAVPYCGEKQWVLRKNGVKDCYVVLVKNENEDSIAKFLGSSTSDVGVATKFNSKKEAEEFLPSLAHNLFQNVLDIISPEKDG